MTEILYSVAITIIVISIITAIFGVVKERLRKLKSVQVRVNFTDGKSPEQISKETRRNSSMRNQNNRRLKQ